METPIIRAGRYVDTRSSKQYTLVRFNSEFLVFQGDLQISVEEFNEYFVMAKSL